MRRIRGVCELLLGLVLAAVPARVEAQESPGRALDASDDSAMVIAVTLGAITALFLLAALGWLYQQRRELHWPFQDPDAPAEHP